MFHCWTTTPKAALPEQAAYIATIRAAAFVGAFKTFQHFYEMDNEMDMWGITHRDISSRAPLVMMKWQMYI